MRFLGVVVVAACFACPAKAQSPAPDLSYLIAHSEVESVLGGMREIIGSELTALKVVTTPDLTQALDRHFSTDALLPTMEVRFGARGTAGDFAAAATLVRAGPIGRADSIAEATPPPQSLDEYAQQLSVNAPPAARVQLVASLAAAQAAGDFFVLLGERAREGAHAIAAALSPAAPRFAPIPRETWSARAEQNFLGAVVSFLHRYQSVSDELLSAALKDWTSDAGQWYVEAYSLALGESIVSAAEMVRDELGAR